MKNIKLVTILSIMLLLTFSVSSIYASNIGRTVYGVFSETYLGVIFDDPNNTEDKVAMYGSGWENSDYIEGVKSVSVGDQGWFGIIFLSSSGETTRSMSAYSGGRIYFSLKVPSSGANLGSCKIGIKDSASEKDVFFNSSKIVRISASGAQQGTGVLADGNWHTYYINLSDFGLANWQIQYPFIIGSNLNNGTVLVDNVCWAKSGAVIGNGSPVLDFTLKNVNGNGAASSNDKFTWSTSVFRNGWKTADQYVDLDLKFKDSSQNSVDVLTEEALNAMKRWSFRIYTSSQTETMQGGSYVYTDQQGLIPYQKNGSNLIVYNNADPNKKLPMCWRMMDTVLSTTSGSAHTNIIGERSDYNLYDLGSSDPNRENWNCWLYIKNIANYTASDKEYYTIWNYKGWHASTDPSNGFFNGWACTPKLYIGAKFTDALAGLEYRNKITIESYYE